MFNQIGRLSKVYVPGSDGPKMRLFTPSICQKWRDFRLRRNMPKYAYFEALTAAVSAIFGPLFAEGASQTIFSPTLEKSCFFDGM